MVAVLYAYMYLADVYLIGEWVLYLYKCRRLFQNMLYCTETVRAAADYKPGVGAHVNLRLSDTIAVHSEDIALKSPPQDATNAASDVKCS